MLKPIEEEILKIATPEDLGYVVSMAWAEDLLWGKIPKNMEEYY